MSIFAFVLFSDMNLSAQSLDTALINQTLLIAENELKSKPDHAKDLVEESLKKSREANYQQGIGMAYVVKGLIAKENTDSAGARNYFFQARTIFKNQEEWQLLAEAYRKEAFMLNKMGDYEEAIKYYTLGLDIAEEHDLDKIKAKILSGLAGIMRLKGEYSASLNYAFKAMKIQEKIGDDHGVSFTYDRIGVVYKLLKNNKKALEFHNKALNIRIKQKETKPSDFGYSYMVIGDNYFEMDSLKNAGNYFKKSLLSYQTAHDTEGISYCYIHLGMVLNALGQKDSSLNYYIKAKEICESSNDRRGLLNVLGYLSNILFEKGSYDEAEKYTLQALKIGNEIESISHVMNNQKMLYLIYRAKGNLQKSLYFHELYSETKDSLFSREKSNEISDLIEDYEHEKASMEESKNKQIYEVRVKTRNWQIAFILALLLLGLAFIFYLLKTNKRQLEANNKLTELNDKIEAQKQLLEQSEHNLKMANAFLEHKVQERTRDLQVSKEQLEQYIYLASHDLKQPLRSISGFSKLLEQNLNTKEHLDAPTKEYLQFITNGVKFMNKLIEDIIDYSRINSKVEDQMEITNTIDLINAALQNSYEVIAVNKAKIELDVEKVELEIDVDKISQVLEQIISNGIRYKKADIEPILHISAKLEMNAIRFEITDNGLGISKEYIDRIFEPFLQLQGKYLHGGSGMGLSICKRIIEQHGGKIWAESIEGEGTKIIFVLPLIKAR